MARTLAELPAGSRITDYISLGVIAKFFPAEKVHEVLEQTKRTSVRERDLPGCNFRAQELAPWPRTCNRSFRRSADANESSGHDHFEASPWGTQPVEPKTPGKDQPDRFR